MINNLASSKVSVSGVILAGGLARRMDNRDKGLICFLEQPLVSYAVNALRPLVDQLFINANRNHQAYQQFGCPVIADQTTRFDGPLAGILTALIHADSEILLVVPCDSPLVTTEHLERLLTECLKPGIDLAVASDGERLHPVFLALRSHLKSSLEAYLASGQFKMMDWLIRQQHSIVDFSEAQAIFTNINTETELKALEASLTKISQA